MEAADAETAGEEEAARGRKEGDGERRWGAPRWRWGPGAARGGGVVAVEEAAIFAMRGAKCVRACVEGKEREEIYEDWGRVVR